MFSRLPQPEGSPRHGTWKRKLALFVLSSLPTITVPGCAPNSAILSIVDPPGNPGQATLNNGQCVTLQLKVRFVGNQTYVDETSNIPLTAFKAVPANRLTQMSPNVFCATAGPPATATIYGTYTDPKTNVTTTATVSIKLTGHS